MLEKFKKFKKNLQCFLGDVIFQKTDSLEAAPLLAPCLKIAEEVPEIIQQFPGDVIFQKSDPPEAALLPAPCLKNSPTKIG